MLTNLFKRTPTPAPELQPSLRETLFGDLPAWPAHPIEHPAPPWSQFIDAAAHAHRGRISEAVALWQAIIATPGLESRHYLQAWHFLRQHGHAPDASTAKSVLGVVVDVHLDIGLDTLAAYQDHSARYLHHSAAALIWDARNPQVDRAIDTLLATATTIANVIGPWTDPRPSPPPPGQMRLSILTPSGLHFGQGPMDQLARDPLAGPMFQAATQLLTLLTDLRERQS